MEERGDSVRLARVQRMGEIAHSMGWKPVVHITGKMPVPHLAG